MLIAIIILATYLRYWRIEEVPPGFNSDEAVGAVGGLVTLRDGLRYAYEGQGGGGTLSFYFVAAAFYLFGPSIATIRGLAAWAGLVGIFAHYWAVRELFRGYHTQSPISQSPNLPISDLNRARLIAGLSTLGLAVSVWHLQASRVAFAGIGVPFLMMPSVYFLWRGLNGRSGRWTFLVSGIFLGGLFYTYLSGVFVPLLYAAFFIAQWLLLLIIRKAGGLKQAEPASSSTWFGWRPEPPWAYMTAQFWNLAITAGTAILLILPIVYVLLTRPDFDPGAGRVSQASFLNPTINQGDPLGLLWRSVVGNFNAYGISFSWFLGQTPPRLTLPPTIGLLTFLGFLISLGRALRGQAAYLFILLWFPIMLLPSILAPDAIPHSLRAIGAINPTYMFVAIFIIWLYETLWTIGDRWLLPRLDRQKFRWIAGGVSLAIALPLISTLWQDSAAKLYTYFYIFPNINDTQAAYHVYAIDMAEEINRETRPEVAFILPRNTAAGDINKNFTTDFLTELAQPPADHYWVVDNEATLAADLTAAAADHDIIRVITWKTSKHTGADPKKVIPYYLEKYGQYESTNRFEYFDIDTYRLDTPAPDFGASEALQTAAANFNGQVQLTGYAFGDAGDVAQVDAPQAHSNDLLWLRLAWQKIGEHPENLKASALLYADNGQLITQIDKLLVSNILQMASSQWDIGATEETYFLIPIPPATPPGDYSLELAVYAEESLKRLPLLAPENVTGSVFPLGRVAVQPARTPVEVDDLDLALPVQQELLPGLTLVGFETLPGESVRSGEEVWASLLWQAGETPPSSASSDLTMALLTQPVEAEDDWQQLSAPVGLAGDGYPTSEWQPGEVLRGWLKARIPPALEPGTYELSLNIAPAGQPEAGQQLPIGEFEIDGWPRNFDAPQPPVPMDASFNDQARLIGLEANATEIAPGETLNARLYWQAEAEFEQNYTAFVHLIGPDGALHGQVDHIPGGGAFPTTGWLPGEYIADDYAIPIAPDAPPGEYRLALGLYNPDTGQRLTITDADCQAVSCAEGADAVLVPGLVVK